MYSFFNAVIGFYLRLFGPYYYVLAHTMLIHTRLKSNGYNESTNHSYLKLVKVVWSIFFKCYGTALNAYSKDIYPIKLYMFNEVHKL